VQQYTAILKANAVTTELNNVLHIAQTKLLITQRFLKMQLSIITFVCTITITARTFCMVRIRQAVLQESTHVYH